MLNRAIYVFKTHLSTLYPLSDSLSLISSFGFYAKDAGGLLVPFQETNPPGQRRGVISPQAQPRKVDPFEAKVLRLI